MAGGGSIVELGDPTFDFTQAAALHFAGSSLQPLDPYARTTLFPYGGLLLILSGVRRNAVLRFPTDTATGVSALITDPPTVQLRPSVSAPGRGRIFGKRYAWRYRTKIIETGEVSGPSALIDERFDLGKQLSSGGPGSQEYVGQSASFRITASSETLAYEFFRNTSGQEEVFYKVGEIGAGGVYGTYVDFTDDKTDEELIAAGETLGLRPNPAYGEDAVFPVAKCVEFGNGRLGLYGGVRMGPVRITVTITKDERAVTVTSTPSLAGFERAGQRLVLVEDSGGNAIEDTTAYRIIQVVGGGSTVHVHPPIAENPAMTAGVLTGVVAEVRDDRDLRTLFQTAPGFASQVDLEQTLTFGKDLTDPLLHVFYFEGVLYGITRRRLLQIDGTESESPVDTYRVMVKAEEGQYGLWAGCWTPYGYVFVNEKGVRLFDGGTVRSPEADTPFPSFAPKEQFEDFEQSTYQGVACFYDNVHHRVLVSYAPEGRTSPEEVLAFDPLTLAWRGPWRRRIFSRGVLRDDTGRDRWVTGDDLGSLQFEDAQVFDVVQEVETGVISAVTTGDPLRLNTADLDFGSFAPGAPIIVNGEHNWVAEVITSQGIRLAHRPTVALAAAQAYSMGVIAWQATTAYIDGGEIHHTKKGSLLEVRFDRPATDEDDTFTVLCAVDGGAFEEPEAGGTADPLLTEDLVSEQARLDTAGKLFQIRFAGTASVGGPRVTNITLVGDLRGGTNL